MSKGSARRPGDTQAFADGWDRIWGGPERGEYEQIRMGRIGQCKRCDILFLEGEAAKIDAGPEEYQMVCPKCYDEEVTWSSPPLTDSNRTDHGDPTEP